MDEGINKEQNIAAGVEFVVQKLGPGPKMDFLILEVYPSQPIAIKTSTALGCHYS